MTFRRSLVSEDGSLPMAILVAIITAGLVLVVFSRVTAGHQQVRFDRDFQLAINSADAGLAQALNVIQQLPGGSAATVLRSEELPAAVLELPGDQEYVWEATLDAGDWTITSSGRHGEVWRTVQVSATQDPDFFLAAFGRVGVRMVGNNHASSYDGVAVDTGLGAIGTNGLVSIIGNSTADIVMLMGDEATCDENQFDSDANTCNGNPIQGYPTKLDFPNMIADVEADIAEACPTSDSFVPFDPATHAPLVGGQTYCFSTWTTGNQAQIDVAGGSIHNPAMVYVHPGPITFGNNNRVNCPPEACSFTVGQVPDSAALQIATTSESFQIGTQSHVAAAVRAPRATCRGNPSSAQADIYGSLLCHQIGNEGSGSQGGWTFHFDARLLELGSGQYRMLGYREEPGERVYATG